MPEKRMPVGLDQFKKIRQQGFYYVDKTGLIKELLENWGEVNLFTRPRRFGKSLNMSMLKCFFETGADQSLFDDLAISREKKLCDEYMGQYPVIALSLKQVTGNTFSAAEKNLWREIRKAARSFPELPGSDKFDEQDRIDLDDIRNATGLLDDSLASLSDLLCKHYGKKVIILIDEYDTPLKNAYENGYYEAMVKLIRQFFGYALKSNESLFFSVLTGCMRISKESIFSDLNNPKLYTLLDERCDEWFGFTDDEVRQMLSDNHLSEYYETTKDWYDGYLIGQSSIYCPWDVINYCDQLQNDSDKEPRNYWANVSENSIIGTFAEKADSLTRNQIGLLVDGKTVQQPLVQELTYQDMAASLENIWGLLFATGYLTQRGSCGDGSYKLCIPNREVKDIFRKKIDLWFREKILEDPDGLQEFYLAFDSGNAQALEDSLNYHLSESISYYDVGNDDRENFYHGILLGMFLPRKGWEILSNRESGKGRSDIVVFNLRKKDAYIIEVKYSKNEKDLPADVQKAIDQINDMEYDRFFSTRTPRSIRHYGVAFCLKHCRVLTE